MSADVGTITSEGDMVIFDGRAGVFPKRYKGAKVPLECTSTGLTIDGKALVRSPAAFPMCQ